MKKYFFSVSAVLVVLLVAYEYQPARYHALLCVDEKAEPGGSWNSAYDGYFLAANGCFYDPLKIAITDIPTVHFSNPNKNTEPLWYINGANLRADWVLAQMVRLTESSGRPVIAIYNSTLGGRLLDALGDAIQGSLASRTAEKVIAWSLAQQKGVYFQVNSQGAVHMAKVLYDVALSASMEDLARIHVLTAGGAAAGFPDGPVYIHLVNKNDPVPAKAGVLLEGARPGVNAEIIRFSAKDPNPMESHFRFVGPLTRAFLSAHGFNVYQKQFPSTFHASFAGNVASELTVNSR